MSEPKFGQWIPASDPPKHSERVFAMMQIGTQKPYVDDAFFADDQWWSFVFEEPFDNHVSVIAWMDFPEPYKPDKI